MAHAYTPGLRVTSCTTLRRERRLPLHGQVLVARGDRVEADTVVARTELPGNVQTVNLASKLGVDPAKVPDTLTHRIGATVRKGAIVAEAGSLFGLVRNKAESPVDGTIESVSSVTGQLVLPEEGVIVESQAAFVQGIFGVGGETRGAIAMAAAAPDEALDPARLGVEHRGKVVVGGAYVSHAALMRAREVGVAAVVVGGFDDRDLRQLLGRDLGVAITGSEELGLTLVLTEGFGHVRMAERTWKLLHAHQGELASVSGATQIRAGVMRPEILIPRGAGSAPSRPEADHSTGLEIGSSLRVIRQPHFGRIGRVIELPAELQRLDSEAQVRVLTVEFADDGSRAVVPRANVELIAE